MINLRKGRCFTIALVSSVTGRVRVDLISSVSLAALLSNTIQPPTTLPSSVQHLDTYQSGVLGSHTGSLDQELLVSQLHTIQPSNCL